MDPKPKEEHWDLVIKGHSSLFDLKFADVWRYRDLLAMFVKRDFISFYKQTILGPLWFFIQPIFTTLVYTFVFGSVAGISSDGLPKPLFYLCGITAWQYFADCLTKTSGVFRDNARIFGKVYFPRLIMPLSIVVSNLIKFSVQIVLLLCFMMYFSTKPEFDFGFTYAIALFPFLIIIMALLGLGAGLIITAMTTKYRDLSFLVSFGISLLMYGTTVIYPLSAVREKYPEYVWVFELNPMTPIIEAYRYAFLGSGSFNMSGMFYATGVTLVALFAGIIIFNRTEKNFVDTI